MPVKPHRGQSSGSAPVSDAAPVSRDLRPIHISPRQTLAARRIGLLFEGPHLVCVNSGGLPRIMVICYVVPEGQRKSPGPRLSERLRAGRSRPNLPGRRENRRRRTGQPGPGRRVSFARMPAFLGDGNEDATLSDRFHGHGTPRSSIAKADSPTPDLPSVCPRIRRHRTARVPRARSLRQRRIVFSDRAIPGRRPCPVRILANWRRPRAGWSDGRRSGW